MEVTAAVVLEPKGKFALKTLQLDDPADDQILVRVVASGMCHTDLICRDQYYPVPLPMVFGHEGAGVVEKVGRSVKTIKPGDHVVLTFNTCGYCDACQSGDPTSCENAFALNFSGRTPSGACTLHDHGGVDVGCSFFGQSSFANYALSYERNTVVVPKDVPLELLGPLGCGIQTGAGSVLNALNPPAGSSIVIFGAGAVGLSAVMGAAIAACTKIIVVDIKPNRLALAKELGATHVINASETNAIEAIKGLVPNGVPYALETTGVPKVLEQAIYSTCAGGMVGIVGAPPMGSTITVDVNFMLFNRKLRGIIEGQSISKIFIPQLIELYKQGKFPFDKLIKVYSADQINQAAEDSEKGVTIKPVIKFS